MTSKRTYIVLIIILSVFTFGIMYLAFNYEGDYLKIVSDPSFKVEYDGNKWKRINDKLSKLEKNFEIYDETGNLGKYNISYLTRNNRWYVYDDKMNEISKTGAIVGYKSNMKYEVFDLKNQEINSFDQEYIDKTLKNNKIDTDTSLSINYKYFIDINGDGKDDEIIVSNLYQDLKNENDAYSMIIANIKNKTYTLYFSGKEKDDDYTIMHASLTSVFSIEKNKYKYVIIKANSFGVSETCVSLIEFTKDGPIKKISC